MKIRQALTEMNEHLSDVEASIQRLNNEVQTSSVRQQDLLLQIERSSEAMSADVDCMRSHAVEMRAHAEQLSAHADQMRAHADQMRADADQIRADATQMRLDTDAMRDSSEHMRLEVSRNSAAFDQNTAEMTHSVQKFRGDVAIVVEFLVNRTHDQDEKHSALEKRVEALERKMAG